MQERITIWPHYLILYYFQPTIRKTDNSIDSVDFDYWQSLASYDIDTYPSWDSR